MLLLYSFNINTVKKASYAEEFFYDSNHYESKLNAYLGLYSFIWIYYYSYSLLSIAYTTYSSYYDYSNS